MIWICYAALLIASVAIAWQDFKSRLISVWWILLFGAACILRFILLNAISELLENLIFCLCYFLFSYLILHLFYFIKTKHFQVILNDKIGWGDIWIILFIGCSIKPETMILFFAVSFVAALLFQLLVFEKNKSIALGGILVVCYNIFVVAELFLL